MHNPACPHTRTPHASAPPASTALTRPAGRLVSSLKRGTAALILLTSAFAPLFSDTPTPHAPAAEALPAGGAPTVGAEAAARARTLHARLERIANLGPDRLGYLSFASEHLAGKYELAAFVPERTRTTRTNRDINIFALLGGGLAVRESLQLDRLPILDPGDDTIPLANLKGPEIQSHPFKDMVADRTSSAPALAGLVPHDYYYLHVQDPNRTLDLLERLGDSLGQLMGSVLPTSVDFQTREKLMSQLALRENPTHRKFYGHVIDSLAIVGTDPFFLNGTDVTIVARLKKKDIFLGTVNGYREWFEKTMGATRSEVQIEGLTVQLLKTPDRRVHSYLVSLTDDTVVISNSAGALKGVLQVFRKKRPSMAEQHEYRYMRSIYPFQEERDGDGKRDGTGDREPSRGGRADETTREAAFLYLSDPFIRRVVGPELFIKESRRMLEASRLAALEQRAVLFYQLHGRRARNVAELGQEFSAEDVAAFAGLELAEASFAGVSKKHGPMGRMIPNIDTDLPMVSQVEADGYTEFLNRYNDYWRTYFDPIGIRLSGDRRIRIETCILPLINNSFYNSLLEFTGGAATPLKSGDAALKSEVVSAGFRINRAEVAKAFTKSMSQQLDREGLRLDEVLGDEIQVHVLDAQPMVDFDSGALLRSTLGRGSPGEKAAVGLLVWSLFHPIRVAVPLKKPEDGEKLVRAIDAAVRPELKSSAGWMRLDLYEQIAEGHRFRVYVVSIEDIIKFRFYYAVHNGTLHFTTTQEHMMQILRGGLEKGIVDRFLDFFRKPVEAPPAHLVGVFRPANLAAERNNTLAGAAETEKRQAFANLSTFLLFHDLFGDGLHEQALDSFGFRLEPRDGYILDEKGNPASTVYGSPDRPTINMDRAKNLKRRLDTKQIRMGLEFTKEGLKSTVEVEP